MLLNPIFIQSFCHLLCRGDNLTPAVVTSISMAISVCSWSSREAPRPASSIAARIRDRPRPLCRMAKTEFVAPENCAGLNKPSFADC